MCTEPLKSFKSVILNKALLNILTKTFLMQLLLKNADTYFHGHRHAVTNVNLL